MRRQWCIVCTGAFVLILMSYHAPEHLILYCSEDPWTLAGDDFEGFDNETGAQSFIVPNYVHFLRIGPETKEFSFLDSVVVLSAFKQQKPDKIFFHTDQQFTGHFWNVLVHTEGFMKIVEFVPTELPDEIYGQKFSKEFHVFHASDVLRIRLLMHYGGIFLDNDMFLVRSLDDFRKFEITIGWDDGEGVSYGTQNLIAHKDARFLTLWHNSYKGNYNGYFWYYNAGELPSKAILGPRPELIHRVKRIFGNGDYKMQIYQTNWEEWKKYYSVHLLTRHFYEVDNLPHKLPEVFTPENIHNYSITLTAMVDSVFDYVLYESLLHR